MAKNQPATKRDVGGQPDKGGKGKTDGGPQKAAGKTPAGNAKGKVPAKK